MTNASALTLLATLTVACATDDARHFSGTTEDKRSVDIWIDWDRTYC